MLCKRGPTLVRQNAPMQESKPHEHLLAHKGDVWLWEVDGGAQHLRQRPAMHKLHDNLQRSEDACTCVSVYKKACDEALEKSGDAGRDDEMRLETTKMW